MAPVKAALLPERSLLCQNLKLAQGDVTGTGVTPVIAANRKDLGNCSTEIKNPQTLLVGSYLSTLITAEVTKGLVTA